MPQPEEYGGIDRRGVACASDDWHAPSLGAVDSPGDDTTRMGQPARLEVHAADEFLSALGEPVNEQPAVRGTVLQCPYCQGRGGRRRAPTEVGVTIEKASVSVPVKAWGSWLSSSRD